MKKVAAVLIPFFVAACASTPNTGSSQAASQPATQTSDTNTSTGTAPAATAESNALGAEIQSLQKESIYFDLDKSGVKPEYMKVLRQQADFAKAHKNDVVTVEGNCDERGSAEYNMSLGERRANAARKSLEHMGVSASQIKTTSLGEEKPRLTCHEEKCWKENRRDDFVHTLN